MQPCNFRHQLVQLPNPSISCGLQESPHTTCSWPLRHPGQPAQPACYLAVASGRMPELRLLQPPHPTSKFASTCSLVVIPPGELLYPISIIARRTCCGESDLSDAVQNAIGCRTSTAVNDCPSG